MPPPPTPPGGGEASGDDATDDPAEPVAPRYDEVDCGAWYGDCWY